MLLLEQMKHELAYLHAFLAKLVQYLTLSCSVDSTVELCFSNPQFPLGQSCLMVAGTDCGVIDKALVSICCTMACYISVPEVAFNTALCRIHAKSFYDGSRPAQSAQSRSSQTGSQAVEHYTHPKSRPFWLTQCDLISEKLCLVVNGERHIFLVVSWITHMMFVI